MRAVASRIGAVAFGILCCIGAAVAEPRVALVIGNSNYGGEIGNLANPANDAQLMAKTLRGIGFDVVEVENADQNAMKRAIVDFGNKLGDAGAEATGLFYYAGHGLQVQGENFLIPVKAQIQRESDVDVEAVSADLVLKQMDFAGSAVNIVILDACRNNPLTRSWRSAVSGLAEPTRKPHGSFIAYSTAPGEVAADGKGDNSPYAKALAETIVAPGEGIEEIFRDVRGKVLAATNSKQTPWDSSSLTAPFYFTAPPAATATTGASTALSGNPQAAELLFWESVKDSKSPEDFQAYLDKYPQGEYVALANNRLKSLGAVASAAPVQPEATIRNMVPGKDEDTAKAYEDAFWGSVKDSTVADDVQAYLNKYPHGRYVGQAQQKLKSLGKDSQPAVLASVSPPTQVAPPLPPFQTIDQQIYARDRARLRATPDKNGEVLGRVAANAPLKATGKTADGAWWRIAMEDGGTAYVASSVVSEQALSPAAAPAAPAQDVSTGTPPASTTPPSGKDEDICPSDSSAAPADRIAACRRTLANATDSASKNTALIELGNNFYNMGQRDEALKNYQAAIDADPKVAASYANIGLIRLDQHRFDEARVAFDKAASLDPDNADDIYQRGVALGDLGSFDAALADVKRAIGMKSDVSDYYSQLGLLQLADGSIEDSIAAIDKASSLSDTYWSGTAVIGYYLGENYQKSIEMIDKGFKEDPDYPYWPIWRAMSQAASGDKGAARQTLADGLRKFGAKWPAPLMRFMIGEISESKLRELANAGDQRTRSEQLCEVEFYRGEMAYLAGDKATAKAAMKAAAGVRIYYYLEDAAARARLAQLND